VVRPVATGWGPFRRGTGRLPSSSSGRRRTVRAEAVAERH
jgi:hypothetical protein